MKLRYDLHLHSCLSPCGDADMTPYNLVNMAKLLELDIIALTDHNTAANCPAAVRAGAEAGITVVPGMELCTSEEIHVVCLFPDCGGALAFSEQVHAGLPPVRNDPAVFGNQLILDERDGLLGEEELLLVVASGISITELPKLIGGYGGYCYPAHIDRPSYSVISALGSIEAAMGFSCAEVSDRGDPAALARKHPALSGMRIIRSSDAHRLEGMREAADFLHPEENTAAALVGHLREKYPLGAVSY